MWSTTAHLCHPSISLSLTQQTSSWMGQGGKTRYRSSGSQNRAGLVHRAMLAWYTEPCWPGSQSRAGAGLVHGAWFTEPGSQSCASLVHRAMLAWFTEPCWPGSQSHAGLVHRAVRPGSQSCACLVHRAVLAWFTEPCAAWFIEPCAAWFTEPCWPGSQSRAGLVHRAMLALFPGSCVGEKKEPCTHCCPCVKHSVVINYLNLTRCWRGTVVRCSQQVACRLCLRTV